MIFLLGKLFWLLVQPGDLLCLVLVVGVVWLWLSRRRRGLALVAFATAGLLAILILPLGDWAIAPLEQRFPAPAALPERIDGIILLGGAVDTDVTAAHAQVALNEAAERVMATLALARRYPTARVLVTGGNGELLSRSPGEAAPTERLLTEDGLDPARLRLETRSRTTYENAVFSRALIRPQAPEIWLLVTSAWHMPRAIGCFRRAGWQVMAYPVDYRTGRGLIAGLGLEPHLAILDTAIHEWVGLIAYRLLGRTTAFFPGPAAEASSSSSSAR